MSHSQSPWLTRLPFCVLEINIKGNNKNVWKVKQTVKGRLSSQSSASPDESLFNLIKSTNLGKEKEWKGEIKLKCTDDIPRHACA